MSNTNMQRKSCEDVFNAFLVKNATYSDYFEFPYIKATYDVPNRLIPFSKAMAAKNNDFDQWVHFYEDDHKFERIWNNPQHYLEKFKKYNGVILPDFSLYRDMPFVMQLWNIYRSRAIGNWMQTNGITVIPNIRYGDQRTFRLACEGISENCVIALGTHGILKNAIDREIFIKGFDEIIHVLTPKVVILYGSMPLKYFQKYNDYGIRIVHFESDYAKSHRRID